jgi:chitin disaccharide deacetylase
MNSDRTLIVNADDFGRSAGINRGIIRAFEHGVVTSASLMVRWPLASAAAAYARRWPALSLGLHLDLGEWSYRDGDWAPLYEVVRLDDPIAVEREAQDQLAAFRQLVGANPTHLDSHQHIHRREPIRSVLLEMARRLDVPLRHECSVRYCGDFYGQDADGSSLPANLTADYFISILSRLPSGITELCCHPAEEEQLDTMYCRERVQELRILCDPQTRAAIIRLGIEPSSFKSLRLSRGQGSHELDQCIRSAP